MKKDPKYKYFIVRAGGRHHAWERMFRKRSTLRAFVRKFGMPSQVIGAGRDGLFYDLKFDKSSGAAGFVIRF